MLISCSICKELFFPNSEVCGTKCGHIYHESCLKKWQERSGSCPQCRTKLREKPHRIYFDVEDSIESEAELDAASLKQKIDNIRVDLTDAKKKNSELEEAYVRVQGEIADYAEKASADETAIKALKQRINELVDANKKLEPLHKTNEMLEVKLKSFRNLEILLKGTENEVHDLVNKTPVTTLAVHQLCLYVVILKSQLKATEEKYKVENDRLSLEYYLLKKKLMNLKNELHNKKIQTSGKKPCKIVSKESEPAKTSILKRPCADRLQPVCENTPKESSKNAEFEPPLKKKPHCVHQKKVINNLEKTVKKDIPSDPDEVLIYPGPSKHKVPVPLSVLDNKSLFKKSIAPGKYQTTLNTKINVAYDVWGRSVRNKLTVSCPAQGRSHLQIISKKMY